MGGERRGGKESKCSNRHGPQQKQHPDLSPQRCEGRGGFSTSEASPAVSVPGSLFSARGPGRGPRLRGEHTGAPAPHAWLQSEVSPVSLLKEE